MAAPSPATCSQRKQQRSLGRWCAKRSPETRRRSRLCIERLVPISRERALPVRIPAAQDALQITIALQAVFDGLAAGQLTASEAQKLAGLLENQRRAIETGDLEERLQALESAPRKDVLPNIPEDLSDFPGDGPLERGFYRCLNELTRLQDIRRGPSTRDKTNGKYALYARAWQLVARGGARWHKVPMSLMRQDVLDNA